MRRRDFEVKKVSLELQIDSRVTEENKNRLEKIVTLNLKILSPSIDIIWSDVMVPRIGGNKGDSDGLTGEMQSRIRSALDKVIATYCPSQCIIEQIEVMGEQITIDQSKSVPPKRVMKSSNSDMYLRVDNIVADITMDDVLEEAERSRISRIMRAKTRFVEPVEININVTPFPETYLDKKKRQESEAEDPYGLEKLRQMLVMFRDLAGTKEIITNTTSETSTENSTNSQTESTNSNTSNSVENSTENNTSRRSDVNSQLTEESLTSEEIAVYVAAFILLITLMAIILIKFSKANRSANEMVMGAGSFPSASNPFAPSGKQEGNPSGDPRADVSGPTGKEKDVQVALQIRQLKEELIKLFMEQPKVAKDTFSRMIREDGIEATARYVKIFGQIVIFELLSDPTLQRDLYELSEYYHRSDFNFKPEEELELLTKLKTKVTASEIRVLTQKSSEKFEFLTKLDAGQIYNLIGEEKMQVQSIVLTQLDRKKRAAVFEMYQGDAKVKLLAELSAADAIPKDYMVNVAQALQKKVKTRPEFDTENLRSSDILLDLLEKSSLSEQKRLMITLVQNNPDTARSLKMKLVTVEILPYLKDGHLLEVILGMDREPLLMFLGGCPEHIRDLLVHKAPEELADSWLEDLETIGSVDEANYRIAEMKITSRIRNLANNGVISLLEINDMIFSAPAANYDEDSVLGDLSTGAVAA